MLHRAWGVQEEYWDVFGNKHSADAEIERSILRSMGFQPDSLVNLNHRNSRKGVPISSGLLLPRQRWW